MTSRQLCLGRHLVFATLVWACGAPAHAQAGLEEAKVLYASAAYTEALAVLRQLPAATITREVRHYQALCLLALGRRTDAAREVSAAVQQDPLYVPEGDEVTPRLVTMFHETRRRLLPAIAQREFVEATRAFLDGDTSKARLAFERLLQLLADPILSGREEFADHKIVSAQFAERLRATETLTLASGPDDAEQPAAPAP